MPDRKGHADRNFSTLRRTALSLLKRESTLKVGIKNNASPPVGTRAISKKSFSEHDLWCNRPGKARAIGLFRADTISSLALMDDHTDWQQ